MFLILQTQIVPNWRWTTGTSVGYARVFCSEQFFEKETGLMIPQGQVTNIASACAVYDCTISGSNFTLPEITLASTTDSTVQTPTYTVVLYDNKNVPRYTLASNIFVDPEFFQNPLTSSVTVTDGFTNAANGIYTWRGIQAGKAYYNLDTFDDSITESAIVWNPGNSHWEILAANGDVYYYTEATSDFPWEATIWLQDTGLLPVPYVLERTVTVSSTWEMLIQSVQGRSVNSWQNLLPVWDVAQTKQYVDRMQAPIPYSSSLIAGKIYIEPDPDLSTHPIAVGINNPRWAGRKYLSDYDCDIAAAILAIGDEVCELVVTCACTVTEDATTPVTMLITMEGKGKFIVDDGKTLNILAFTVAAAQQYFFGLGDVVLGQNACGPILSGEWWCGKTGDIADCTHGMTQAVLSAANQGTKNGGGTIAFGSGRWAFTEIVLPKMVSITGAGMDPDAGSYSPFTYAGTVFKLYDETTSFLFKIVGGSRFLAISECALTVGAAPAARCIYHTVTEFTDGLWFRNVVVQGTFVAVSRAAATPLIEVYATAFQQSTRQILDGVWMQVPENGVGYYCNTANTTVTFNNCKGQALKGAVLLKLRNCGPGEENNCDWEGINDYADLAYVFERDIDLASVERIPGQADPGIGQPFALMTLDPSTPSDQQFVENDKLRRVDFGSWGGAYIVKINSAFEAILSFYPDPAIVDQPCTLSTFTEFPNPAYAVREFEGNIVSWTVNGGIDEGFNYSLIAGCATFNNFQFNNYYAQARFVITESVKIDINSGHLPACAFEDALGQQALQVDINDVVFSNTCFANQLFTIQPTVWRIQRIIDNVSISYTPHVSGVFPAYDMFTDTYNFVSPTISSTQWEMFADYADYGTTNFDPVLSLYTKATHGTIDDQKPLLRVGKKDFLTNTWTYYYDHLRNEVSGRYEITGDQTGQGGLVGLDLNGDIYISNFRGSTIYPAQITVNADDYTGGIGPNDDGLYDSRNINVHFQSDFLSISGVVLDYLAADGIGFPDGTTLSVTNIGTTIGVLRDEDAASTDIARLKTCTGQLLYLMPGCSATLKYVKGTSNSILRWFTSLDGVPSSPVFEGAVKLNTVTALGTTGTVGLNAALGNRFTMAITGAVSLNITNIGVGQQIFLNILTTTTNAYVITFNSPFKAVGSSLTTSAFNTVAQTMHFMEFNGFMQEVSRGGVVS